MNQRNSIYGSTVVTVASIDSEFVLQKVKVKVEVYSLVSGSRECMCEQIKCLNCLGAQH